MATQQQQQAPMVNVTAETKQNADEFMNTLTSMFETIEALANDGTMKEGDYVKLSREFVRLSQERIARVKTTIIYVEQERVSRLGRVIERKKLTKQQKLDDEVNFKICPSCKKVLKIKSFAKHMASGICKHIADVSGVVSYNTGAKKIDDRRVKLSAKRIFGGRSIAERSLVLAERLKYKKGIQNILGNIIVEHEIRIYDENNDELVSRRPMRVIMFNNDCNYFTKYKPTLKYGTEDKITWVVREEIQKSTLIPYLKKCWEENMMKKIIPKHLIAVKNKELRKSSWKKCCRGKDKGKWKHGRTLKEKKVEEKKD